MRNLYLYLDINESSFDNLWIMIILTSVYVLILLPFLSIIKEKEMIECKDYYNKEDMDVQHIIEKGYERISLSFVEAWLVNVYV